MIARGPDHAGEGSSSKRREQFTGPIGTLKQRALVPARPPVVEFFHEWCPVLPRRGVMSCPERTYYFASTCRTFACQTFS